MIIEELLEQIRELEKRIKKLEEEADYFTKAENVKEIIRLNGVDNIPADEKSLQGEVEYDEG